MITPWQNYDNSSNVVDQIIKNKKGGNITLPPLKIFFANKV